MLLTAAVGGGGMGWASSVRVCAAGAGCTERVNEPLVGAREVCRGFGMPWRTMESATLGAASFCRDAAEIGVAEYGMEGCSFGVGGQVYVIIYDDQPGGPYPGYCG
jgi:hypothetical protein